MNLTKIVLLVLINIFIVPTVEARLLSSDAIDTQNIESSRVAAVAPGTRLVAGDSSQNEFYIVGRTSEHASQVYQSAKPKPAAVVASRSNANRISVAINETLHKATYKKLATKNTLKRVNANLTNKIKAKQKIAKIKKTSRVNLSLQQKRPKNTKQHIAG